MLTRQASRSHTVETSSKDFLPYIDGLSVPWTSCHTVNLQQVWRDPGVAGVMLQARRLPDKCATLGEDR